MVFSTSLFLFYFLPLVFCLYFCIPATSLQLKNIILFILSILFYAWGEPICVFLMLLSIVVNWKLGLLVQTATPAKGKFVVTIAVIYNISVLILFKYLDFIIQNINNVFNTDIPLANIALPIGISFFTFQALSYVIDIYRSKGTAQRSPLSVGLYISLFPQLIAGPIVRYETIALEINNRRETFSDFCDGSHRFIIGLAKKVLIADNVALLADTCFNSAAHGTIISTASAWLGVLAYTLEIYYDFSGYSDMAIGLGKMFGFHFNENFNYPYIANSITNFWRRWHISLSSWFRDYVYFPLGGNRVTKRRHIMNLLIIWSLTGLWHGASWNFVLWGLLYFILLVFEKYALLGRMEKLNMISHIYTLFFVMMGWVIFRCVTLDDAKNYYSVLFNLTTDSPLYDEQAIHFIRNYGVFLISGIIFSTPIAKIIESITSSSYIKAIYSIITIVIFIITISQVVNSTYSPFIYFNF